jgi:hypothetical protein
MKFTQQDPTCGKDAEKLVAFKLRSLGYGVQLMQYHGSFDLLVGDKRVEVKYARPSSQWRWCISIHRGGKLNETSVDVYVIVLDGIPGTDRPMYIILSAPVSRLTFEFSFGSLVRFYSQYVDNWTPLGAPQNLNPTGKRKGRRDALYS